VLKNSFIKVAASMDSDSDLLGKVPKLVEGDFSIIIVRKSLELDQSKASISVVDKEQRIPVKFLFIEKRADEEFLATTFFKGRSEASPVTVGFTSDVSLNGNAVNVKCVTDGKAKGVFVLKGLDDLRNLFLEKNMGKADRIINKFAMDPETLLIPSAACEKLDISEGSKLALWRDPISKPLESFIRK
jgi:hypothetical protein